MVLTISKQIIRNLNAQNRSLFKTRMLKGLDFEWHPVLSIGISSPNCIQIYFFRFPLYAAYTTYSFLFSDEVVLEVLNELKRVHLGIPEATAAILKPGTVPRSNGKVGVWLWVCLVFDPWSEYQTGILTFFSLS